MAIAILIPTRTTSHATARSDWLLANANLAGQAVRVTRISMGVTTGLTVGTRYKEQIVRRNTSYPPLYLLEYIPDLKL
ncbi:hypothetical protein ScPMuIL_009008 [Solemya velum]